MRERRLQFASGCYYHLYNRGANRTSIFLDDRDYYSFLARLKRYAAVHETAIITYCLMPNHYHLLVRQETDDKSSLAVQFTCNGYSQFFNRRHERSGTLFQGRFRRILVDNDEYLRCLCRYIHTNPVKDGFALRPELWPYSNYQECVGLRRGTLVDHEFITTLFGSPGAYRDFVAEWPQRKQLPTPLNDYLEAIERKE
jgi:REP element-mobilizing transposase RayT